MEVEILGRDGSRATLDQAIHGVQVDAPARIRIYDVTGKLVLALEPGTLAIQDPVHGLVIVRYGDVSDPQIIIEGGKKRHGRE